MRVSLAEYCQHNGREDLLKEWDAERNAPLTPETVSYSSHKKVWWVCAHGHHWQTNVYSRTSASGGTKCPMCSGRVPIPGVNDLATRRPDLAKEWHPTKNGDLTPRDVLSRSSKKVWWRCEHGHEWEARIKARASGTGCPVCSGRKVVPGENDLATLMPELAKEWHPTKNGDLRPSDVRPGSVVKVWWRCEKGHEWQATVSTRGSGGAGCPVCKSKQVAPGENDLASAMPELAKEWHPTLNGDLTPDQVMVASNARVWWQCPEGHAYQAVIASRTQRGTGCPYCANRKVLPGFNDLATKNPELAREWHPTLNGDLTPQDITPGCSKKVWWQCAEGHVWKTAVYARSGKQHTGCPICAGRSSKRYK